jgi:hypothetical protein
VKQLLVQVLVYSTQPFRLLNCSEQALGAGARSRCSEQCTEHLLVYPTQPCRLLSFHVLWLEISECEKSEQVLGAGARSRCSSRCSEQVLGRFPHHLSTAPSTARQHCAEHRARVGGWKVLGLVLGRHGSPPGPSRRYTNLQISSHGSVLLK